MSPYPMQLLNGLVTLKKDRLPPTSDYDQTPRQLRRYMNASGEHDVQIGNGLRNGVARGRRVGYRGTGYLWAAAPIIPGQTRGDAAGFHKRGPDPWSMQKMWEAGPGSQPVNPGGPGKIAGPLFFNPMSG